MKMFVLHKVMIVILFCMQFCHVVAAAQGKSQPMTVEKAWDLLDIKKADRENIDTMDKLEKHIESMKFLHRGKWEEVINFEDDIVEVLKPEVLKNFISQHSGLILNIIKNDLEQKKNNDYIFQHIKEHYFFQDFDPNIVVTEITKIIETERQKFEEAILELEKKRKKQQEDDDEEDEQKDRMQRADNQMAVMSSDLRNEIVAYLQTRHSGGHIDINDNNVWDWLVNLKQYKNVLTQGNLGKNLFFDLKIKIMDLIKETKEKFEKELREKDLKVKQQQEIEKTKKSKSQSEQKQSEPKLKQNPSAHVEQPLPLPKATHVDPADSESKITVEKRFDMNTKNLMVNAALELASMISR